MCIPLYDQPDKNITFGRATKQQWLKLIPGTGHQNKTEIKNLNKNFAKFEEKNVYIEKVSNQKLKKLHNTKIDKN